MYPAWEIDEAVAYAGVGCETLCLTSMLDNPGFTDNSPQRCYHCKRALFEQLLAVAELEGLSCVADGTNKDDEKTTDLACGLFGS